MGLNLTIQLVLLASLTKAGTASMKCCTCTQNTIASNIYQGLNVQDHKINTSMFHELRNDISRNYPLNIWYLQQAQYLKQLGNVFK